MEHFLLTHLEQKPMLLLLQRITPDTHLKIHLNDENIIRNLTKQLDTNENLNWFHLGDDVLFRALVARMKARSATTILEKWQKDDLSVNQKGALEPIRSTLDNPQ